MRNLCRLGRTCHQLAVYDNSRPLDESGRPPIRRLLHWNDGKLLVPPPPDTPRWAKPVAAVILQRALG